MAPFAIHWMRTQRGKESAGYESRTHPGHGYAFIFRHHNKEFNQYRCTKCRKVYNQNRKDNLKIPVPPAAIRVFGNQFLSDPDQLPHICMENGPTDDTLWAKILEKGSKNNERGENGDDPQAQNEEAQQQDSDYEEGVIEVEVNEEEDDNKDFKMAKAHGKADAVSGKENGRFHPSTSFRSCTQRDTGIGNNSAAAGGEAMHANQFTLQVSNQQETEPFGTAQNVSGVYTSLHERGQHGAAFAMKKKVSRIAEEYEELLYKH